MLNIDKKQNILWPDRLRRYLAALFRRIMLIPIVLCAIVLLSLSVTLPIWGLYTINSTLSSYLVLVLFFLLMLRSLIKKTRVLSIAKKLVLGSIYLLITLFLFYAVIVGSWESLVLGTVVFVITYGVTHIVITSPNE